MADDKKKDEGGADRGHRAEVAKGDKSARAERERATAKGVAHRGDRE